MEKSNVTKNKKRKVVGESSASGLVETPTWEKNELLSSIEARWRLQLYLDKVGEKLGWMAALTFVGAEEKEIYIDEIMEWMSTLTKEQHRNEDHQTIVTCIAIVNYDKGSTKPEKPYDYILEDKLIVESQQKGEAQTWRANHDEEAKRWRVEQEELATQWRLNQEMREAQRWEQHELYERYNAYA
ncbi:hypothetical protein E3N88_40263 [Mikania micrantha]|uniref:Uncharacterized protein n=1 Tax=Mikania micrantha TaxID=192012 RepID=A0A5N6LM66_9ASTR|nr:hypothetical protein E3N88_40263 [Mikania micrantha]